MGSQSDLDQNMSATFNNMDFSVAMELPGGNTFEDVTALFEQAGKGETFGRMRRA